MSSYLVEKAIEILGEDADYLADAHHPPESGITRVYDRYTADPEKANCARLERRESKTRRARQ